MGKIISGIAALSVCAALSVNTAAYAGSTILTDVAVQQAAENKKAEKPAIQLLKDASAEISAMSLWEHNGSTTEMCLLFDKDSEQEIIDYINGINLSDAVEGVDTDKLKGSMYGIEIGRKDGLSAKFIWYDGYIFPGDGNVYKADIDFGRIKNNYSWQEKDQMPLSSFPNIYYIAKKDGKWNKNFLEKSQKLKSKGLKLTTKKFDGTNLVVKLKNKTKKELFYGEGFSIQANIDGKWYCIPSKEEMAFIDIAYIMKAGQGTKKTYNLSPYGELPSGKYRIVIEGSGTVFNIERYTVLYTVDWLE